MVQSFSEAIFSYLMNQRRRNSRLWTEIISSIVNFPASPADLSEVKSKDQALMEEAYSTGAAGNRYRVMPARLAPNTHNNTLHIPLRSGFRGKPSAKSHTDENPLPFTDVIRGNPWKRHTTRQQKIHPSFLFPFSFLPALSAFSFSFPPSFHSSFHHPSIYSTDIYYSPTVSCFSKGKTWQGLQVQNLWGRGVLAMFEEQKGSHYGWS